MNPVDRWNAEQIVAAASDAGPVARLIIGDLQAGRATFMDDMFGRVDALEAQHGPIAKYALINTLAHIADAHGARGDPGA